MKLLADSTDPRSLGYRARQRRMEELVRRFPNFSDMRIIDLGGTTDFWRAMPVRPAHVTLVAIEHHVIAHPEPWMDVIVADACDVTNFSARYDFVFSNSVIEHVGGPRFRRGFAETVRTLAPHYWVQTPYRYFPYEPHFKFPLFQFLPRRLQFQVARRWPFTYIHDRPGTDAVSYVMDHDLLTATEMRSLFPGAELVRERLAGLPKSLIATR